jgi:menaquinone-dependent protoporphyrinogen oxidase
MSEVPVFYATTAGQTRRIAERLAERLRTHGLDSRAIAIGSTDAQGVNWNAVRGVAVGASVHAQRHQKAALAFARQHRVQLSLVPSLFFSVCLAAASKNADEVAAAQAIAEAFGTKTGWQATRIVAVAGRLAYTQYNWLMRRIMRRIAVKEGGSADMSRDHEYTNWEQVERLADELAFEVRRREVLPVVTKSPAGAVA